MVPTAGDISYIALATGMLFLVGCVEVVLLFERVNGNCRKVPGRLHLTYTKHATKSPPITSIAATEAIMANSTVLSSPVAEFPGLNAPVTIEGVTSNVLVVT